MVSGKQGSLGFIKSVRASFSFLFEQGFTETAASHSHVRFEKGNVGVDIFHDPRSCEIDASVTVGGERFYLGEMLKECDSETSERYRAPAARTPKLVSRFLDEISLLVKTYCGPLLAGDRRFVEKLEKQRKHASERYWLESLARRIRPKAQKAFRNKEYSKAAELYGSISEDLTPAELRKWAYAKRKTRRLRLWPFRFKW